jgi:hypothetical protein
MSFLIMRYVCKELTIMKLNCMCMKELILLCGNPREQMQIQNHDFWLKNDQK